MAVAFFAVELMKALFFYCVSVSLLRTSVAASGQPIYVPRSASIAHATDKPVLLEKIGISVYLLTLTLADLTI